MLHITSELITYLNSGAKVDGAIVKAHADAICKYGSKADAVAILDQYLLNPSDFYANLYFIGILKKWGDHTFAERIFDACIEDGKLKNEEVSEPLELLGEFRYAPAKPVIAHYVFNSTDYYLNRSAVFGLLSFNCDDLQDELVAAIKATYGKNLFNEFVPALVAKVYDKKEILEELFQLGNETASTDCNGGIVMAFSLCGEAGYPWFKKVLFNENWEVGDSGTGTGAVTYEGMKTLKIQFLTLLEELKALQDQHHFKYALGVFFSMLSERIADPYPVLMDIEPLTVLYQQMFAWQDGNTRNNIIDLAAKVDLETMAEEIESQMSLGLTTELAEKAINYRWNNAVN